METADRIRRILRDYPHINEVETWGETAFFYNPDGKPRRTYLCTVKYGNHCSYASGKQGFLQKYGKIASGTHQFDGRVKPHEHYAWMQWMTIIDPTNAEARAAIKEAFTRIAPNAPDPR